MKQNQMDRVRGARAVFDCHRQETPELRQQEMFAFLRIFHPEIPMAKALRMAHDAKQGKEATP